jgi:hypothetical protein
LFKKIVSFFLIFSSIFFLITFWKHAVGFIRSNTLDIQSENVSYVPVTINAKGFIVFAGLPVYSDFNGKVELEVEPGNYVEKGDAVCFIVSGDKKNTVLSPASGVFINYGMKQYYNNIDNVSFVEDNQPYPIRNYSHIEENGIIGSIVTDNNFYVCLQTSNSFKIDQTLSFIFDGGFLKIDATVKNTRENNTVILLRDYLNLFFNKNEFTVIINTVKGIVVNSDNVVNKNGKSGILIINGNRISYFETNLVPLEDGKFVASVEGYNTLLVVKKGLFFGQNEIIGGF